MIWIKYAYDIWDTDGYAHNFYMVTADGYSYLIEKPAVIIHASLAYIHSKM